MSVFEIVENCDLQAPVVRQMTRTRVPVPNEREPAKRQALGACIEALRQVAEKKLPQPLERKIRKMIDAKESLTGAEHEQLLTLVEVAQEQSLQKVKAQVALELLRDAYPDLKGKTWRASAGGSIKR